MDGQKMYCQSCTTEVECTAEICPVCGKPVVQRNESHQLPGGTILRDRYFIGRCIGEGGFGITYIGRDLTLNLPVAVKEYYPVGMVNRFNSAQLTVSMGNEASVNKGKKRFLDEARILAKFFDEPNIVSARDFFEANGTAYIVTEYLQGISLRKALEASGPMPFSQVFSMLSPVMDALEKIHRQGLVHRDINPSNLIQLTNGIVKLIDFGTARDFDPEKETSKSVIVTPGYAPEEQYLSHGEQGPWTDVYGLCATMYKLITGKTPTNSLRRVSGEVLARPSELGAVITPGQENVLLKGLAVRRGDRFSSMEECKAAFVHASEQGYFVEEDDERTVMGPKMEPAYIPAQEPKAVSLEPPRVQERYPEEYKKEHMEEPKGQTDWGNREKATDKRGRKANDPVPPREGKRKKKRKLRPGFLVLGCFALLIVLGITFIVLRDSPYDDGEGAARLSDTTVTRSMIRSIGRDPDIWSLNFSNCQVDDQVIQDIGRLSRIRYIDLDGCSGFTTLAPLADMPALTNLDLSGKTSAEPMWTLDGTSIFSCEFQNVASLSVTNFTFSDQGAFLKQFPALSSLYLSFCGNSQIDLTALDGSDGLAAISLGEVSVVNNDYSALGNHLNLERIYLNHMGVSDISWMENLAKLSTLELNDNLLHSLDGLQHHEALYSLDAAGNQIDDIFGLQGCSTLSNLNLQGNQLQDISPLAECEELSTLELSGNQIADVSALSGCTQLTTLNLNDNRISDISPLQGCTKLAYLYLNRLQLTNLDACEAMIDLQVLCAQDNQINDVSGLSNTTQLKDVRLSGNQIADISYLSKNAGKMKYVLLSDNQISDISSLAGNSELAMVTLDNNQLTNLDALSEAKGLQFLSACGNQLTDISGISGCASLAYIDLGDNQIQDISPLSTCTCKNQGLLLHNNKISDISGLPSEVDYELLTLYGNPISDFSAIQSLSNINYIWDTLYLSWDEKADYSVVSASPYQLIHFVDVPLDRQASLKVQNEEIKKENGVYAPSEPTFQTFEEAQADVAAIREESRENQENVAGTMSTADFLQSLMEEEG